ncbi:hypothetical protein KOR34_34850 [Posidoniimonas corsicana]|uniref:Uncharacterized protein n=1 Tax=Posidoniimonas corsicana TaxID=1938618 RepID=A0A5C5V7E3_9BACT|nr:hypothetical protein [Posidoniimonas corsicana]TWT33652.1 hypothetical protein KOR34_34850 [Posidoniimonas corsicana]
MPDDSGNPYASPEAAADNAQVAADGRMPGSVKLAIGCLSLFAMVVAANLLRNLADYGGSTGFLVVHLGPLAMVLIVLAGVAQRSPIAAAMASLFSAVGAMLLTLVVLSAVAVIVAEVWAGIGIGGVWVSGVPGEFDPALWAYSVAVAVLGSLAGALWTVVGALRTRSARVYFGRTASVAGRGTTTSP